MRMLAWWVLMLPWKLAPPSPNPIEWPARRRRNRFLFWWGRFLVSHGIMLIPDAEYLCPGGLMPPWKWRWAAREKREEIRRTYPPGPTARYEQLPKSWYRDRGWPVLPGESTAWLS